jgi:F0F1-type ATP synthase assembly protein I
MAEDPQPEIDDFDERLRSLEARADEIQASRQNANREARRQQHAERESALGIGAGLSIAYTLIGLPLLGAGLGWVLEQRGLRGAMALGVLIGAVLGLVMAFITLGRTTPKR